jgi:hypothetical protein
MLSREYVFFRALAISGFEMAKKRVSEADLAFTGKRK